MATKAQLRAALGLAWHTAAEAFYDLIGSDGASGGVAQIDGAAATLPITGLAAAQGGDVTVKGGTSSTSANAGGAANVTGGAAGATGVGGAAAVTGAAGGATSGTGGAASLTGGAGTAGNAVGGAATHTGGAGQGTGAGGVASVTGGASGAGATGNGGAATVTGGAAASTNGSGGSVVLAGGAKAGSGIAGGIVARSGLFVPQAAPAAKTTAATLTGAEVAGRLITANQGGAAAANYQFPTGTDLLAALPAGLASGDAFYFHAVNISTNASEDITFTTNTDLTLVGNMVMASNAAVADQAWATFLIRYTGGVTFSIYRVG